MTSDLYIAVRDFVAKTLGVKGRKLDPNIRLAEDLGLTGADAAEFLEAFRNQFGIDMNGFEFGRHFGPEATFDPIGFLRRWVFERKRRRFTPITLANLAEVVERGCWKSR